MRSTFCAMGPLSAATAYLSRSRVLLCLVSDGNRRSKNEQSPSSSENFHSIGLRSSANRRFARSKLFRELSGSISPRYRISSLGRLRKLAAMTRGKCK
ncbi:hypothetical protein BDV59DRAFT_177671 [Aspergillus ambiguus]|uniref:uncharacterized protein n=1 Tax=Aspergillus ambiguus TaxID=176160 RepID=UPI003CCE41F4